jgi:hypothetical protein
MTLASAQHDSFKLGKLSILRHKKLQKYLSTICTQAALLHQPARLAESDNYNVENIFNSIPDSDIGVSN